MADKICVGWYQPVMRNIVIFLIAAIILYGVLCLKRIHPEGDHISLWVLAPKPTLQFVYFGGEEGQWRRENPTSHEPWWMSGKYYILYGE